MFRFRVRLSPHVQRPLKWELIETPHARKSRNRWVNALEVHEAQRVAERFQFFAEVLTEPWVARLHGGARTPLSLTERKVIGYLGDGLDAHPLQFFGSTGMESRQIPDVVVWERGIATVVELACDGVGAMASCR